MRAKPVDKLMVKEHPILFSSVMVNAIKDGIKTETRRVIKPDPIISTDGNFYEGNYKGYVKMDGHPNWKNQFIHEFCPYGKIGDILWVRETFGWYNTIVQGSYGFVPPEEPRYPPHVLKNGIMRPVIFKADYPKHRFDPGDSGWKPCIHMPRTACRILLQIKDLGLERLTEITNQSAINEGIKFLSDEFGYQDYGPYAGMGPVYLTAIESFRSLWDSINADRGFGWHINPWVWRIKFDVLEILK